MCDNVSHSPALTLGVSSYALGTSCCDPTPPEELVEKCKDQKPYNLACRYGWCEVKERWCDSDVLSTDLEEGVQKVCGELAEKWAEEGKDICKDELNFDSSRGETGTSSESGGSAGGDNTRTSK